MNRVVSLALIAGVSVAAPAFAGPADGVLNIAWERSLPTLDAYFSNTTEGHTVANNICDSLIARNPLTYELEPLLATGWVWASPTEIDVDLRADVRFHNGAVLSADDVVSTLNWASAPETGAFRQFMVDWISLVEKLDDLKVRIHLKEPNQAVLDLLAGLPIYPAVHFAEVGAEAFGRAPVCTGPYRVASFEPGSKVELEINEDYFEGSPKGTPVIPKVVIRSVQDPNTRVAELMTGRVDWIHQLSADQADQLATAPGKKVLENESNRIAYVMFNPVNPPEGSPVLDQRVRQAVGHAIDREAMVEHLVRSVGKALNTYCHPRMPGCIDGVFKLEYDPGKAKELLAEAGYPDGFEIDLFAFRDRHISEALIGDLQAVGIRANLQYMQYGSLDENWQAGRLPFAHQSWVGDGMFDAGNHLTSHFLGGDTIATDPFIQGEIRAGNAATTQEARDAHYGKALTALGEGVYWVPLYTMPEFYAVDEQLGFEPSADGISRFYMTRWN